MLLTNNKYHAFISYRHLDNSESGRQWATWLHQAIETYQVPEDLVGNINRRGEVIPERIFPVFRDEEALPADADLSTAITHALDNTSFLVVLCSPKARESSFVADEIRYFKQLGHSERIIAAILYGEPNASLNETVQAQAFDDSEECFPRPLQFMLDENGDETSTRTEPIAADFRATMAGKAIQGWTSPEAFRQYLVSESTLSKTEIQSSVDAYEKQLQRHLLKIIAGIIGVSLDELSERDKAYQLALEKQRARRLRQWLAGVAVLAIVAIGAGIMAWQQQQVAEAQRDRAEALLDNVRDNLHFMNYDLRDVLTQYVPTDQRRNILQRIDQLADLLEQDNAALSDADLREKSTVLIQKANLYFFNKTHDIESVLALYQQAHDIRRALFEKNPENEIAILDLALSYEKMGDVSLRKDNKQRALELYLKSHLLGQRAHALNPSNQTVRRNFGVSKMKLGNIHRSLNNYDEAYTFYSEAKAIREQLVIEVQENTEYQFDLGRVYQRLGDLYLLLEDKEAANVAYQDALNVFSNLTSVDPANINFWTILSEVYKQLGYIDGVKGNLADSVANYLESAAIRQQLVEWDPQNVTAKQDLARVLINVAKAQHKSGQHEAAIDAYDRSLVLWQQVSVSEPDNVRVLRDIVTYCYEVVSLIEQSTDTDRAAKYVALALAQLGSLERLGQLREDEKSLVPILEEMLKTY